MKKRFLKFLEKIKRRKVKKVNLKDDRAEEQRYPDFDEAQGTPLPRDIIHFK